MTDLNKTQKLTSVINETVSLDDLKDRSNYVEVEIGSTLAGRYRINAKIGEGGMGMVYHGFDGQLGQDVAIKLLKRNMSQDKNAVEKLKQEAQVAMMLTHPYIMRLINFEQAGEYAFLLMEFVKGETLDSLAAKNPGKKLDQKTVGAIGYKVCQALEYAHDKNVIHRDIKPANIMINKAMDAIKLMDFGIARALMMAPDEKHPIAGTISYIAPEIFEGAPPDPRVDIYALGLTLYELLAGSHPFQGKTVKEIINQHFNSKPPALEGVDRNLANIVFQCIEKKPNARYQTAKDVKNAFAKYLDIDEGAKVTRMKARLEHEKRQMDKELRRLEREKEKLESEKKDMERERTRSRLLRVDPAVIAEARAAGQRKRRFRFSPFLAGVSVISGAAAALAGTMIIEGSVVSFENGSSYETVSAMVICAIASAAPSAAENGLPRGIFAAVAGAILGYFGHLAGASYIEYSIEHDPWTPYTLISYLATSLPVAVAAAVTQFADHEAPRRFSILFAALAAALVSAIVPYFHIAEDLFGLDVGNANYFYIPFLTMVIWAAVDMWASDEEG